MKAFAEQLREKGLKVTPQRMAIYEVLSNSTDHPTAEQVWEAIKEVFPAVSFNTVYTTLNAFEQCGLLQRLHIGDNIAHYDATVAPHVHLTCRQCGRVDDHHGDVGFDPRAAMQELAKKAGYRMERIELNGYGLCSECTATHE
ncbi:MAG TPA: Fur family transcriptional regulator [Bacillota bacterium]|nr:Fur family transcriptional regulator [Bacillota bacterium]